jgi:predicted ATPase/class 3 adenylate cyclase
MQLRSEVTRRPVGSVALLFTDIEGSTVLARALGGEWPSVLEQHYELLLRAIQGNGGYIDRATGDGFFALFEDSVLAVRAAVSAQRALARHPWPPAVGELRVRMGLHTGVVEDGDHGYMGLDVHLAARVEAAAHGGQIVVTAAMRDAVGDAVPTETLGEHRLKDFPAPELLFQVVVDGRGASAFPPLRTAPVRPTNLPVDLRPLVGREREMRDLRAALLQDGERLVTVLGLGGIGKTQLALAVAAGMLDEHLGGVWVVSLANTRDPDRVFPAIAAALGVSDEAARDLPDVLAERLDGRSTLLVLDNFEPVVAAGAAIGALVDRVPALHVLVTSQLPLRARRERVYRLDRLSHADGVRLFEARAGLAPASDADTVTALVERVDGVPLAIELAAARLGVVTPRELLRRLDGSVEVLARGPADLPERQRSVRATLEWTFELLTADERALLARLAAFAGPAPLDAIEAVTEAPQRCTRIDTLDALSGLLDASLVHRLEDRRTGVRFAMVQAVRDFAAERLGACGEEPAVRDAHARWVAKVAAPCRFRWDPGSPEEPRGRLEALEDEQVPALLWAREHQPRLHLELASTLTMPMTNSGRTRESCAELTVALERYGVEGADAAWAAAAHAFQVASLQGPKNVRAHVDKAEAGLRAAGDDETLEVGLRVLSLAHLIAGDNQRAASATGEAVAIARRGGSPELLFVELLFHAQALIVAGRLDEADVCASEALVLLPDLPADAAAYIAAVRGDLALAREDWATAAAEYAAQAGQAESFRDQNDLVLAVQGVVLALGGLGRWNAVAELFAIIDDLCAELGISRTLSPERDERLARLRIDAMEAIGESEAVAAGERGRGLRPVERIARITALASSAVLA